MCTRRGTDSDLRSVFSHRRIRLHFLFGYFCAHRGATERKGFCVKGNEGEWWFRGSPLGCCSRRVNARRDVAPCVGDALPFTSLRLRAGIFSKTNDVHADGEAVTVPAPTPQLKHRGCRCCCFFCCCYCCCCVVVVVVVDDNNE